MWLRCDGGVLFAAPTKLELVKSDMKATAAPPTNPRVHEIARHQRAEP